MLVGASHYADPEAAEGATFVFWGGAAGPASIPDWSHQLNQPNAMLGSTVSGAGDVNNDGFADIMVGAPGYESSWMSDEGMVKVFHGESGGLIEPLIDFSLTPNPILEGSPITLFGSFTAADPAASFTLTVAWGDGSPDTVAVLGTARSFDAQHTFADNGGYIVSVSLSEPLGTTLEDTAPVTVQNVAPNLALSGAASVAEGVNYLLGIGAVVDPGDDTLSACQVDWGDGSPLQDCLSALGGTLGHIFPNGPASHTVRIHLTDEDGTYQNVDTLLVDVSNVAPVAVDDEYTTPPNHQTIIAGPGVLANDQDVPADSLTASLVSGASTGSLSLQPDGGFTYTPPSGFIGTVTFTYRATDADDGVSNTATVTLTVDNIYLYLPVLRH